MESCGNGIADEELLEAAEIPLDGRVFLSVCVPSTEVHTEPGGTQYTLYMIQVGLVSDLSLFSHCQSLRNNEWSLQNDSITGECMHCKRRVKRIKPTHDK